MIKILIADDHLIIRQGLRLILETENDLELVGEASDGNEAISLSKKLNPDVVLMDLRMPNMDGLTAIEKLRIAQPHIAVVILTTFNEDELMVRGLQAGAHGYLLKDTDRNTLFNTIRAAARGETLLKPEIMTRVLSRANTPMNESKSSEPVNLTERELEVLKLICQEQTANEISKLIFLSPRTVEGIRTKLRDSIGVKNTAGLVRYAVTNRIAE